MKKEILIYGAYGEGNIGDDLLLETIIKWIEFKKPNSRIFISANNQGYLNVLYPSYKIISKFEARTLKKELHILGGGTQFFSFKKEKPQKRPNKYLTATKTFVANPLLGLKIIRSFFSPNQNKHKIAIGLGLGPFEVEGSDKIVGKELSNFEMIYSRDDFSHKICMKYGIPSTLSADICFSKYFRSTYSFEHKKSDGKKFKVGVILRDWNQNGIGEIINAKMISWINANKDIYEITIFLFSSIKDKSLTKILKTETTIPLMIWDPYINNSTDYLKIFSEMDLLITTRFHAAVFGANFNIPTICLGIDPKLFYLVKEVDGFVHLEYSYSAEILDQTIHGVFNNYEETQQNIIKSRLKIQKKADDLFFDADRYL